MYILGIKYDCVLGNFKFFCGWLNYLFYVFKFFMCYFVSFVWNLIKLSEKLIFWFLLIIGNIYILYNIVVLLIFVGINFSVDFVFLV